MAKKKAKKRRILKAKISFISLCPRGANTIRTMYKADDGKDANIELSTIIKGDLSEQGELLAVVYAPDMTDSQGDTASAEVIKQMAYDFAKDGEGIDIRHNEEALNKEDIFIAENFIIQKNDPRFADTENYDGDTVDVTGGWGIVIKINSEELRKQYRDGAWGGVSMGGLMLAKPDDTDSALAKILEKVCKLIPDYGKSNKTENIDMKDSEIVALVSKTVEAVVTKVLGEKKEEAKKEDGKKLGMGYIEPVLKANPTEKDIEQHEKSLAIFELSKAVDRSSMTSIREFQVMSKEIIEGKEGVASKTSKNQPFNAFHTNQGDTEIKRSKKTDDSQDMCDNILKEMDDEAKAGK